MPDILAAATTTIPTFPSGSLPGIPGIPATPATSIPPFVGNTGAGAVYHGSGTSIGTALGSLIGVVAVVALLALVGILVIVVVANRADPDPSGRRPQSVYFFGVSFITIIVSVIGSTIIVSSLVRLVGTHDTPIANSVIRVVVLGALITVFAMALLVTHLRRGINLALAGPASNPSPSRRVGQSYVSAVAFLAVLVLLIVAVLSVYVILVIAAPGVFGSFGGRAHATRYLIEALYVGGVMVVILLTHSNLVPPGLRFVQPLVGTGGVPDANAAPPNPGAAPSA
jgi:hypothetical protein